MKQKLKEQLKNIIAERRKQRTDFTPEPQNVVLPVEAFSSTTPPPTDKTPQNT